MSSKNFYGLTGDVTIDGGILNVANTNVSGNVTSTSLLVSNVATLGTTKTFVVRASGGVYYIDEDARKSLELHEGQTYIFDLSHSSLASGPHPLEFATQPEGANSSGYTTGISATGTLGTAGAKKTFVVSAGAPTILYYYCTQHSGMGGQINISPAAELVVSGRIVASGNVEASKITASANVEVTGNVVASKFVGDGSLLTSVTAATTSGLQVVTDNSPTTTNTIEFTNPTTSLRASSNIVATGNVTADHFIGDGSRLSGIVTSLTLEEVVNTDNTTSNTVQFTNTSTSLAASGNVEVAGNVVASGNVEAAYFIGDGSQLSGIVTSVTLEDAVNAANTTSNTVQFTNTSTSLTASGNVEVSGNVVATYFVGDGSRLTGISGGSGGTSHWTKDAVTNQLYYNASSVGVSNTNPAHDLSVGSNLYVDDDASDGVLMVTGNVHGTYFVGDGSRLINLPEGGGSTNWTTSGSPVNKIYYPQNPGTTSVSVGIMNAAPTHTLSVGSNLFVDDAGSNVLHVDGNITAESMFLGALGIRPAYPLDSVTDTGNVTPHTISFTNPTLGITTASNVEIGGALVVGKGTLGGSNLEVGEANLFVNTQLTRVGIATDQPAATLHVNGSLAVDGPLTFGTVDVAAQHGLEAITAVDNTTPLTIELQNVDTSLVTTGNVEVGGNVITSKDLTVTGNVTTNSELIVAGNVFYTNLMSVSVKSNVVTEYTGPHDRPLRKYPEVAFPLQGSSESAASGATTFTYKSYTVTSNSVYSGANYKISNAFDGTATSWSGNLGDYDSNGDVASGRTANYLQIQLPNAINLENIKIISEANYEYANGPRNITLYGSNNGSNWVTLKTETDLPLNGGTTNPDPQTAFVHVNTTTKYLYYKLEISKIWISSGGATYARIGEWELYGHEEGSGSLDTTLKTVYNVPATTGTQLEVYYDGQDYTADTDFDQANEVLDKSGNNLHGSQNGGVGFDSTYKAFTFDGNGDYIRTSTLPSVFEGDPNLTQSAWVYFNELSFTRSGGSDFNSVLAINASGEYNIGTINELAVGSDGIVYHSSGARGIKTSNPIISDNWYHITVTKTPGNTGNETQKIYINGVLVPQVPWNASGTQVIGANPILTIGGSGQSTPDQQVKGSIANVRLYSKVLNAEQIQELYDYQKDYFLGSKSQVTLYKGHLGVGVTEPSGQLELAGDERIQEYPPRALTGYETLVEGHGVFTASASSYYGTYYPWKAFDRDITDDSSDQAVWHTTADFTNATPGIYNAGASLGGYTGAWLKLKLPYSIKPSKVSIHPRTYPGGTSDYDQNPKDFLILGSKDDNTWDVLSTQTDVVFGTTWKDFTLSPGNNTYNYIAISCTKIKHGSYFAINDMKFFGTPGPTTLDKGSLTLGRSLDVPRVSRYDVDTETPRPEKLVVDFDTTVNSSPTDISGKGNHGAFYGNAQYSPADKAFKFDGSTDYIKGNLNNTGDTDFTVSLWLKKNTSGTVGMLWNFGGSGGSGNPEDSVALEVASNNNLDYFIFSGAQGAISNFGVDYLGKWVHIVATRSGNNLEIYLDGVDQNLAITGTDTLQLAANTEYTIGARGTGALGNNSLNGYISNFKVYNVVLEPSEVKKLYRLGRTGRSMVISDTAVGIGRAPEAQLDVRGTLAVRGRVGVGTSSPNAELHVVGASGQLTSAQHYGFASGGPATDYGTGVHNTVSIYGNDDIVAGGYVLSHAGTMASSDERVKKEIVDVEDGEALSTLRLLKPKQYKYRDDVKRGTEPVWGFIAQEVSATLPYATQLRTETVPNIYELANVSDSNVITFTNFDTSTLESNVFNIKVFDTENNEHTVNLTEIINERSIRVNKDLSNWTANVMTGNQIFVYGQQVDDFTFLKKDAIWTVATAALQEVDRQLQNEKIRNDTLETRVSDLLERVAALENA